MHDWRREKKARVDKLQEITIHHRNFDLIQLLVEYGVKHGTDENECLLQFTVKIKY